MPKKILAANWKMNKTSSEVQEFLEKFKQNQFPSDREIVICPPYPYLPLLKETGFKYGAENMYWEDEGAFTGEISAKMLKNLGCEYVILGHSERREYFKETDEDVNKKVKKALESGLTPIFCLGESEQQREEGKTQEIIKNQLENGLKGINDYKVIVVAYEPIWAIGTGKTATPEQAQEVHAQIREFVGEETSILYGGSVKSANISELMAQKDINGGLVGGASLDPEEFAQICNFA
ncbi:MAG: triose-phosphate isomerase [Patescibacteria group bacterium]